MVVAPYLWHKKISQIDYVVLSHPQADHMNGLRFIAKAFRPKEFWYNGDQVETETFRDLMAIIEAGKIKTLLPSDLRNGIEINGVRVNILHPDPDGQPLILEKDGKWLNNNSLVLKSRLQGKDLSLSRRPGKTGRGGVGLQCGGDGQEPHTPLPPSREQDIKLQGIPRDGAARHLYYFFKGRELRQFPSSNSA